MKVSNVECLPVHIFAICFIRIKDITMRLASTCPCTRTHPCRVRCGQMATCFRCRSWAGYTINMFEFEFFGQGHEHVRRVEGSRRAILPNYGLRYARARTGAMTGVCRCGSYRTSLKPNNRAAELAA